LADQIDIDPLYDYLGMRISMKGNNEV